MVVVVVHRRRMITTIITWLSLFVSVGTLVLESTVKSLN